MHPLSPQEIMTLRGGGSLSTAEILKDLPRAEESDAESPLVQQGTADAIIAQLPIASDEDEMKDYSADVTELANNKNKLWESSNSADFQPNGKINFLHLDDNGLFTLTVIKPGSKSVLEAQIPASDVAAVWGLLSAGVEWDKSKSPETWSQPNGDADGNIYIGNRFLPIGKDRELHWVVQHKNVGKRVQVLDKLTIENK